VCKLRHSTHPPASTHRLLSNEALHDVMPRDEGDDDLVCGDGDVDGDGDADADADGEGDGDVCGVARVDTKVYVVGHPPDEVCACVCRKVLCCVCVVCHAHTQRRTHIGGRQEAQVPKEKGIEGEEGRGACEGG